MLNCCEMDTTAYSTIAQALNVMKTITHNMNEMKRRHERAVRVQEVQSMLVGWDDGHDLMTLGELLLEVRLDCSLNIKAAVVCWLY